MKKKLKERNSSQFGGTDALHLWTGQPSWSVLAKLMVSVLNVNSHDAHNRNLTSNNNII